MVGGRQNRAKPVRPAKDGVAAIMDIAYHFNWRPEARRAIFYLGDEALKGGNPQTAVDVKAADNAIRIARRRQVKVFTYLGRPGPDIGGVEQMGIEAEYERVATETGGHSYAASLERPGSLASVLADIICLSADGGGQLVQLPSLRPNFDLRWGDGPRDNLETDDVEPLYLSARNLYTNIILKEVTVLRAVISDAEGNPVPALPDDTPSVSITPSEMIYFGDLRPADPQRPDDLASVTREVVLVSQGARGGDYWFDFSYGYTVEFTFRDKWQAPLRLAPNWWRLLFILLPLIILLLCCLGLWYLWPPLIADPGGPYYVNEAQPLQFDGSGSTGLYIAIYHWDFGDGGMGSGIRPTHTYDDGPAQFTVTLTISDRWGRTDSGTTQAIIYNLPPTAEAGGPYTCPVGETIRLTGTCNDPSPVDAAALTCTWADFSGAAVSEPVYTCPSTPGQVAVTLTATDKDGASAQDTALVTVNPVNLAPAAANTITLCSKNGLFYCFDGRDPSDPDSKMLSFQANSSHIE